MPEGRFRPGRAPFRQIGQGSGKAPETGYHFWTISILTGLTPPTVNVSEAIPEPSVLLYISMLDGPCR
jgi:hypothetical protein